MGDTNVQKCNCCKLEWDCINGLCEMCSDYNYKLQKQSDLLTVGLLKEKNYISAISEQFSKSVTVTRQFHYPKAICENLPPEQFNGFNACLSCPMLEMCRLLYKRNI